MKERTVDETMKTTAVRVIELLGTIGGVKKKQIRHYIAKCLPVILKISRINIAAHNVRKVALESALQLYGDNRGNGRQHSWFLNPMVATMIDGIKADPECREERDSFAAFLDGYNQPKSIAYEIFTGNSRKLKEHVELIRSEDSRTV